jgi:cytochrome P450
MEIAGVPIARGTHLQLLLASANHDEQWLPGAEEFDVTRDEAKHMAFSQGIHYCLGAPLARLEGEIAVATLLARLPQLQLAVPVADLTWRSAIELRGLKELPVRW